MLLLAILVVGLIAGLCGRFFVDDGTVIYWPSLIVVGLFGSFLGGSLTSAMFGDGLALSRSGVVGAIIGAVGFMLLLQLAIRKPFTRT